jgi:hypothetical protein
MNTRGHRIITVNLILMLTRPTRQDSQWTCSSGRKEVEVGLRRRTSKVFTWPEPHELYEFPVCAFGTRIPNFKYAFLAIKNILTVYKG